MNNMNNLNSPFDREGFSTNSSGQIFFENCELYNLANKYGTPCYIFSENIIRRRIKQYIQSFTERGVDFELIYAGKAFLVKAMCQILSEEGVSLDASSGGEIYTALSAGFPPEKIFFHGNNKSPEEIKLAIKNRIGTMMVDSENELFLINQTAQKLNLKVKVMLRINPGVDTHTHQYIQTGQIDSKFGINMDYALTLIRKIITMENIIFKGLHCHIGSQILDLYSYITAIQRMVNLMKQIKDLQGIDTPCLDLGGGLGIRYLQADQAPSIESWVDLIIKNVKNEINKNKLPLPKILIEPGRSIVGEAGITLYTIGNIKETPGKRKYLIIDGGMVDNPRPILYGARYEAGVVKRKNDHHLPEELVTIAGKCCESGDILIKDIRLLPASPGDLLVIFSSGAYHYSMSSNYNRLPKPPVVLVNQGRDALIVKGEDYQDIIRNDEMPEWLIKK